MPRRFGAARLGTSRRREIRRIPIPGATVTAIQGDKKVVTTTDDQGAYSFPDLADGVWNVQVEMLGFAKKTEEVGIAPNAPSPTWDLKLLSAPSSKRR